MWAYACAVLRICVVHILLGPYNWAHYYCLLELSLFYLSISLFLYLCKIFNFLSIIPTFILSSTLSGGHFFKHLLRFLIAYPKQGKLTHLLFTVIFFLYYFIRFNYHIVYNIYFIYSMHYNKLIMIYLFY